MDASVKLYTVLMGICQYQGQSYIYLNDTDATGAVGTKEF